MTSLASPSAPVAAAAPMRPATHAAPRGLRDGDAVNDLLWSLRACGHASTPRFAGPVVQPVKASPSSVAPDAPPLSDPVSAAGDRAQRDGRLAQLLQQAASGDAEAFERFYDDTVAYAQALGRRMLGGADLEDLLSDAYFQAWREAGRFDAARGSAVTWLLTIVRSRALDALRRARALHECCACDELPDAAADTTAEPPEVLSTLESSCALREAMAALSAQERWLLGLAYFRELSHAQISATTGLPLGTVKSAINRAQAKLRDTLAPTGREALLP